MVKKSCEGEARISTTYKRSQQAVALGVALLGLLAFTCKASAACPNASLRAVLESNGLPDCRAYELVSPSAKYGWPMFVLRVSAGGSRAVVDSLGSLPGSNQVSLLNFYQLARKPDGWETAPLNTPTGFTNGPGGGALPATDTALDSGLFEYRASKETDLRATGFYVRSLPDGLPVEVGPRLAASALETNPPSERLNSSEPSASADLSHVLFMLIGPEYANGGLIDYVWPGDTTALRPAGGGWTSLYEYVRTGSEAPSLVGVDAGNHLIGQCGTVLGYPSGGDFTSFQGGELYNAISSPSGSRIFFTVAGGPCEEGGVGPLATELFAKEDSSSGAPRSVAISEPTTGSEGDCVSCDISSPQGAVFQGASEDGSKVFFLSDQHLLGGAKGTTLYEYDFSAAKGTRVRLVAPEAQGVSRVSEDGSRVYFVSQGVLTNTANPVGTTAQPEVDNLYVYNTQTGDVAFVATLSPNDAADWQIQDERPVEATPDGRYLVFISGADLTPGDTSAMPQVFEYDALAKTLVRVSREEGGIGGDFAATIAYPSYTEHFDPSSKPSSVSDDGSVVVFASQAALTVHAIFGYNNIYEYHNGHVYLISDGQDRSVKDGGFPSVSLVGVDASGENIFFTTADQLVPQDGDTQEDVYDARIEGGFLPASSEGCESEGCQGPLAPSMSLSSPGSLSQAAGDQIVEPPHKLIVSTKVKGKRSTTKAKHRLRKAKRRKARGTHHNTGGSIKIGGHR
jgi:hypothetical protein